MPNTPSQIPDSLLFYAEYLDECIARRANPVTTIPVGIHQPFMRPYDDRERFVIVELSHFDRYGMPRELIDNVDVWVHEFTESAVRDVFINIDEWDVADEETIFVYDDSSGVGYVSLTWAHIMAALSTAAMVNDDAPLISGDEYWEYFVEQYIRHKTFLREYEAFVRRRQASIEG